MSLEVLLNMLGANTEELRTLARECWNGLTEEKRVELEAAVKDRVKTLAGREWQRDSRGYPIRSDVETAQSLLYCLEQGSTEDALAHTLTLLHRLRQQKGYRKLRLRELNERWGIKETDGGRR